MKSYFSHQNIEKSTINFPATTVIDLQKKKKFLKPTVCTLLLFFLLTPIHSQKKTLVLHFKDSTHTNLKAFIDFKKKHEDSASVYNHVKNLSSLLQRKGFLDSEILVRRENDSLYIAQINTKTNIKAITLTFAPHNKPDYLKKNKVTIPFENLEKTIQELQNYYETQGAAFTEIQLKHLTIEADIMYANVQINLSKVRTINKVIVKGYSDFPEKFTKHHLKLKPTTPFNQELLQSTSNSLKTLDFVSETKKPEVLFTKDSTLLYIYLAKKRANRFDGLVGFSTKENSDKLQFNGYIDLQLKNIFNQGTSLTLYWNNNGNQQETLKLGAAVPYIFKSPISPEVNFEIYKQDSTFINIDFKLRLKYLINKNNRIGLAIHNKSSTYLLEHTTAEISSYNTNYYGLTYDYNLQHKHDISTRVKIASELKYGTKTIDELRSPQYNLSFRFTYLEILSKRSRLFLQNSTATLIADNIVHNELFLIGGANSIRGFNEQSIFCSSYNHSTIEYRLLTNFQSYLYTFSDIGFTENKVIKTEDRYYSFGLGYAYNTKAGAIDLSYAFGKQNKEAFDFNGGMFHIKLTSFF